MMQQFHLTAWQAQAPWPKISQIEQDLRLSRGVDAIFSDDILSRHLAMRGGTVLHKAHLAPAARYSEDIDLVLIKPMSNAELEKHLLRVLPSVLGRPSKSLIADIQLTLRNALSKSKIMRIEFKFVPLDLRREETIKVEINLNEHASLYPLVDIEFQSLDEEGELKTATATSYDIDEMLATKTRALLQRHQGRDLFDLWYAWYLSGTGQLRYPVNCQRTMEAFTWYMEQEGERVTQQQVVTRLDERLNHTGFCSDMDTLLRPGLLDYNVRDAAQTVKHVFFEHLNP